MKNPKKQAVNDVLEYIKSAAVTNRIFDEIGDKAAKSTKYDKAAVAAYDQYKHLATDETFIASIVTQVNKRSKLGTGLIFAAGGTSVLAYQRFMESRERTPRKGYVVTDYNKK